MVGGELPGVVGGESELVLEKSGEDVRDVMDDESDTWRLWHHCGICRRGHDCCLL